MHLIQLNRYLSLALEWSREERGNKSGIFVKEIEATDLTEEALFDCISNKRYDNDNHANATQEEEDRSRQ